MKNKRAMRTVAGMLSVGFVAMLAVLAFVSDGEDVRGAGWATRTRGCRVAAPQALFLTAHSSPAYLPFALRLTPPPPWPETAVALEGMDLEHNAAANDAANDALGANSGMGLAIDSAFASHSGGNAAANDAGVGDSGEQADDFFGGKSGSHGNAAENDADVDDSGEQADDFFGGSLVKSARSDDDAGQPRNYLAGLGYQKPNYLAGRGW
jgi:hypothetical protein